MNLFHLRYFVTLAKSQNYTRAACQLNITQPSLSNAIHGLEAELGLALFVRQGRNVVLTSEGREFSRIVDHSLTILDSGIEQLQHQNNEQTVIKLAALRTLSTRWVPGMVREFLQNSQQDVRFEFTNENRLSPQIIQGLRAKHYDICFCSKVDEQEDIAYFPIASQALVVITPTDHPLATRNQIELSETLAFDQVTFSKRSGLSPIIRQLFAECGGQPHSVYAIEEDEAVAGLVANGFGIAVVPNMPLLKTLPVKIIPLSFPTWQRIFYMATLKDHYQSPAAKDFIDFVHAHHADIRQ